MPAMEVTIAGLSQATSMRSTSLWMSLVGSRPIFGNGAFPRSDKFVSLNGRVAVGNRYRDAVFVSIHFNSASNRGATGIETFYYTPQSELLAYLVHANVIHKTRTVDRGVKHRGFRVIRNSRNPSILVEGGFLSNRGECRRCISRTHRQKLAESESALE